MVGIGLVIGGLVLFPASLLAQSSESATSALPTTSTRLFLPVVQGGSADGVNAALTLPNNCITQAANATLSLGPNVAWVESTGANYFHPGTLGCNRWVVDIKVPYNSGTSGYSSAFSIGSIKLPTDKAHCNQYRQTWSLYGKGIIQTSFAYLGGGWLQGVWHDGELSGCDLKKLPGYQPYAEPFYPPGAFSTTYRVVNGAYLATTVGKIWQPVTVYAGHIPNPK
jgi:hypothetical protein